MDIGITESQEVTRLVRSVIAAGDPVATQTLLDGQADRWILTLEAIGDAMQSEIFDGGLATLCRTFEHDRQTTTRILLSAGFGPWAEKNLASVMGISEQHAVTCHRLD